MFNLAIDPSKMGLDPRVPLMMYAIANNESAGSGDYDAYNGDSGASGRYQYMPDTWNEKATKYGVDPSDHSPYAQDYVTARYINDELLPKFGVAGTFDAWIGGPGNVGNDDASDGGSTIAQYRNKAMNTIAGIMNKSNGDMASVGLYGGASPIDVMKASGMRPEDSNEPLDASWMKQMALKPLVNSAEAERQAYNAGNAAREFALLNGGNTYEIVAPMLAQADKQNMAAAKESAINLQKNLNWTRAADVANKIAQSNNSSNRAAYAALGANITGVKFDPTDPALATVGMQAKAALSAIQNNQNAINRVKMAEINNALELDKAKKFIDYKVALAAATGGNGKAGSAGGAGANGTPNLGAIYGDTWKRNLESQEDVDNYFNKFLGDIQFKEYVDAITSGDIDPTTKTLAYTQANRMAIQAIKDQLQRGNINSAETIADNVLPTLADYYIGDKGTGAPDIAKKEEQRDNLVKTILDKPDPTTGYTMRQLLVAAHNNNTIPYEKKPLNPV